MDLQRLSDVEGTGSTDALEKLSIGSSDATFFSSFLPTTSLMPWAIYTPSTHLVVVAGLCGSAQEFKTPRRSYPIYPSA
jgi:hypothetical protein